MQSLKTQTSLPSPDGPQLARDNAHWNCPHEGDDLNLITKADSSDWENIFRIPLIPSGCLDDNEDITVKMKWVLFCPSRGRFVTNVLYDIRRGFFCGYSALGSNHE